MNRPIAWPISGRDSAPLSVEHSALLRLDLSVTVIRLCWAATETIRTGARTSRCLSGERPEDAHVISVRGEDKTALRILFGPEEMTYPDDQLAVACNQITAYRVRSPWPTDRTGGADGH